MARAYRERKADVRALDFVSDERLQQKTRETLRWHFLIDFTTLQKVKFRSPPNFSRICFAFAAAVKVGHFAFTPANASGK
jgi:hypothetical protein